jgi:hypothetical protein
MEITYNWVVSSMNEYPTTPDGLDDVVFVVNWRRTATTVVNDFTYFTDTFGALNVPAPSPEDFIPYPELTFEQVCGWLDAGLDVVAIDANLTAQIEKLINPTVVSLPLPWDVQPIIVPATEPTRTLPEVEETPESEIEE